MSDEVQVSPDLQPAVAPEPATAAPVETAQTEEAQGQEQAQEQEKPVKTFSQDELNEVVKREKAKAEAKAERRAMRAYQQTLEKIALTQQAPQAQAKDDGAPRASDFANVDDYVRAAVDFGVQQAKREQAQQQAELSQRQMVERTESLYSEASREEGFDRDEFDALPLTPSIAQALVEADAPAKVMAWMTQNPDEVERIAKLSPARQAIEIGKVEARIASAPKPSNAPPPVKPIGTRGNAAPNDPSRMNMDEYKAWRAKQGAHWAR